MFCKTEQKLLLKVKADNAESLLRNNRNFVNDCGYVK